MLNEVIKIAINCNKACITNSPNCVCMYKILFSLDYIKWSWGRSKIYVMQAHCTTCK